MGGSTLNEFKAHIVQFSFSSKHYSHDKSHSSQILFEFSKYPGEHSQIGGSIRNEFKAQITQLSFSSKHSKHYISHSSQILFGFSK
jgi:hypothetical protein